MDGRADEGLVERMAKQNDSNDPSDKPCNACIGNPEADKAFKALNAHTVQEIISESHFSVRITHCACERHFVVVSTEIVDWNFGEDDQTWMAFPIQKDEADALALISEHEVESHIIDLSRGRRFVLRRFPTGEDLTAVWRDSGFWIGPHD